MDMAYMEKKKFVWFSRDNKNSQKIVVLYKVYIITSKGEHTCVYVFIEAIINDSNTNG